MADLPTPPKPGQMILFDYMEPPLLDNAYRMSVDTQVSVDGTPQPVPGSQSYFNVEGPRFSLAASEVAGMFPPRNGHGPFDEAIPHVALYRRTLPWERLLDSQNKIGRPQDMPADQPVPWMALLLLQDGEYILHQKVKLEDAVPADALARMGLSAPTGITCDTLDIPRDLAEALMPSVEELALLTHVRWVSVDDRELSAGSSDGWFSVVMSNRLPQPGSKCRACLVSLEERVDLVPRDPPPTASDFGEVAGGGDLQIGPVLDGGGPRLNAVTTISPGAVTNAIPTVQVSKNLSKEINLGGIIAFNRVNLMLLFSWTFECTDTGTFRDLMQRVDVGMIGKVAEVGHPPMADTGHLPIQVQDRAGTAETAWYRGPFVPFQLTRDPNGPYHSADQARRVSAETGAEDISYAAAFEAGRLLAIADGRLGQELMRWRREAYQFSSRRDTLTAVQAALAVAVVSNPHQPIAPGLAASVTERMIQLSLPRVDPYGLDLASRAAGLDPKQLQLAWNLASTDQAAAILGGDAGALGAVTQPPPQTPRAPTNIDLVARDAQGLSTLTAERDRILQNTLQKISQKPG